MTLYRRDVLKGGSSALLLSGLGAPALGRAAAASPPAASAEIAFDPAGSAVPVSPLLFGQFIEFLGRSITGGLFEEGSPLSDAHGFRRDVAEKVLGLRPTLLRYPGGTVTKIYHWQDGVGPVASRPARPNLIWGGIEDNHFGTDEFIRYARLIGAEPFLTVSMGVGTAEEAANWVEYCNGTRATSFADQRRRNGFDAPHGVTFWGLGNEEDAEPDAGRLQDPADYAKEAWYFTKLMKLQDPSIKLIAAGGGKAWNERVIHDLHPAADYISAHIYLKTSDGQPLSLIRSADDSEKTIAALREQIGRLAPAEVADFNKWYRFPPRQQPMRIALDEIGIWEDGGAGVYAMETTYSWTHALATATLYNMMIRNADIVGLATWAQTVNVLAPILTDARGSIRQTVYFVMELYRRLCGGERIAIAAHSPAIGMAGAEAQPMLDVSCTRDPARGQVTAFVVNRHPTDALEVRLSALTGLRRMDVYELNAPRLDSANSLERPAVNVVTERRRQGLPIPASHRVAAHSITALVFR